jgi:phosphotransacetylase
MIRFSGHVSRSALTIPPLFRQTIAIPTQSFETVRRFRISPRAGLLISILLVLAGAWTG